MSSFLFRKRASSRCWVILYPKSKSQLGNLNKPPKSEFARILDHGSSSFSPKTSRNLSESLQNLKNSIACGESFGLLSKLGGPVVRSLCGFHGGSAICGLVRFYGTQAAQEPSTSDGLTVDGILNSEWSIHTEDESDWKSHAAAIAQSIHLIKKRLQWNKLMVRLDMLSVELNKPNLWDDPVHAGKISREHGSLMGKMKEVKAFEQELLEHVDMIKLAREGNDTELESESMKALLEMRRTSKDKETQALLAGEQDPCSCYIEVQSGAGGTESNDWAAMVMQMYKLWAQRRGYKMTVVEEMPSEIVGIKRATIKVDGEYVFGYAKAEVGVHRLKGFTPHKISCGKSLLYSNTMHRA